MSHKSIVIDLSEQQVFKAVEALRTLTKQKQKTKSFLGESEKINLQFSFQKIPATKNITINLKLPNPLTQGSSDVCLFVKDIDKRNRDHEPTVRHFKTLLNKKGVNCITEVIPLKSLKLEYKPFEAKRNLSNMYDVYLADDRIVRLLPTFLGKNFYGRKRIPVPVNLQAVDLKKEINEAVNNSRCHITGKGSSCLATVAHTEMTTEQVVENIIAAVNQLATKVPGGHSNIKLFLIKTLTSPSVPLYASIGSPADVQLPKVDHTKKEDQSEPEEITTLCGAKVRVTPHGKVFIIKDGSSTPTYDKTRHRVKRKHPPRPTMKQGKTKQRKQKIVAERKLKKTPTSKADVTKSASVEHSGKKKRHLAEVGQSKVQVK